MGFNHGRSAILVVMPVAVAGCIYILFRHESLLMFDWLHQLHLMPLVAELRTFTVPLGESLPGWIRFSLPDGLWLLSYLWFLRVVWADGPDKPLWAWTALGLVMSFGHELGQATGLIAGTFDWADVAAYLIATVTAFSLRPGQSRT